MGITTVIAATTKVTKKYGREEKNSEGENLGTVFENVECDVDVSTLLSPYFRPERAVLQQGKKK